MKTSIFIAACFATLTSVFSCENNSGKGKTQQQTSPVNSTNVLTATPDSTNKKGITPSSSVQLNPAHGAPGHRCELAVGAPLTSPATTTPTTATTEVIKTPTTIQAPLKTEPAKTTTRLNPPHGQPGHNCAVEVGKPL